MPEVIDKGWYKLSNKLRVELKSTNCLSCGRPLNKRIGPRKFVQRHGAGFCSRGCYVNCLMGELEGEKSLLSLSGSP